MTDTFHRGTTTGRRTDPVGGSRKSRRQQARQRLARCIQHYRRISALVLRICLGLVFCWFGLLKFFPGASSAEGIAVRAMTEMSFGLVPARISLPLLAILETAIGLCLITGLLLRCALAAFFLHMAGVFLSLLLLPGEMWRTYGAIPTLEGQYVIKNVVLVAACLHVAADRAGARFPREEGRGRAGGRPEGRRPGEVAAPDVPGARLPAADVP